MSPRAERPRQHNSTIPARTTWIKRGGPIKPKPRKPRETERAHGPAEYRAWMKTEPCIVRGCRAQPCDSAHIKCGGKGRKDNWQRTVALCSTVFGYTGHHEQYDNAKRSFPILHGLDMAAEAEANQARWRRVSGGGAE